MRKIKVEYVDIDRLKEWEKNPRINDEASKKLSKLIKYYGFINPIIATPDGVIRAGHTRYKAAKLNKLEKIPVIFVNFKSEEKAKGYYLSDNKSYEFSEWDLPILKDLLEELDVGDFDVKLTGFEENEIEDLMTQFHVKPEEDIEHTLLIEKFIAPPFSILDTRQGYWQERKRLWNNLIMDKVDCRKDKQPGLTVFYDNEDYGDRFKGFLTSSLLDPVLSEIVCLWFGLNNCKTFDCFAGDTVFGFVSGYIGNEFIGIELRQEQVDFNNERCKKHNLKSKYFCDDGQNISKYIRRNSQDLLFSCPPYFDLEKYSDLPNDASNQKTYKEFLQILDNSFTDSIKCLKKDRFAVIVVSDIRNKEGFYYNFPEDIKNIFLKNNMELYNEIILINAIGTLAVRANKYMKNRKIGKCHQDVLVFYKGNPKEIKNNYKEIKYESRDLELFGLDKTNESS